MSAAPLDSAAREETGPRGATSFAAYAVPSRSGPHVTMQAGVVHADRFWTTTSGSSLKARSVRAHRTASVVVAEGDRHRVLAGRTNHMRPFKPLDVLRDPFAPLRSTSAVVRLGLGQVEQLIGYFEAAGGIPADWLPHRRVLLVTRIDRSLELDGLEVVAASGRWHRGDAGRLRPGAGTVTGLPLDPLPDSHAGVVAADRPVHLGLSTRHGPVALPARWTGDNRFEVSADALRTVRADLPGRAAAVFDDSASRRPDEKLGVMFRGSASLHDVDGPAASVLIRSQRVTTWNGFEARTVPVR